MKRMVLILASLAVILEAKVNVVASYAYIADLVKQVGGEEVSVSYLAKPTRDPHFIVPKPSFIAKVRNADLLIINGGELEIGWIPPLIAQAGNPDVQPGAQGYVALSESVDMIDRPVVLSRTEGDVHPGGNPHFAVDMYQVPKMADAVTEGLCRIDAAHCEGYRTNRVRFVAEWNGKTREWEKRLEPLEGMKVIQAHKLFDYLLKNSSMVTVDTLEPIPGVPPTAKHIAKVIGTIKSQKIPMLITSVYFPVKSVELVKEKTGIRVVTLPHDVGAVEGSDTLDAMFERIVETIAP